MDPRTIRYYDENAPSVFDRQWSAADGIARYFSVSFPAGARVLDVGCGAGRDLIRLLDAGYDAHGVEPSESLRRFAAKEEPRLAGRVGPGQLPDLGTAAPPTWDGVLCSAVLMHIPPSEMFDSLFTLRSLLKPSGRLLLSIPLVEDSSEPAILTTQEHRDLHGRLMNPILPESLSLLLERLGFQRIGQWENEDSLGRRHRTWVTLLFEKRSGGVLRPIDQIEGVLNRDRKFATYKLALFRALCDIARTSFRSARWRADGTVAVPLSRIAEQWLAYYWPLVESERFIPQRRGERQGGPKPIAFRPLLGRLVDQYRGTGGLGRFLVEHAGDALPAPARKTVRALLDKLGRTIRSGPVTYAGGSLETGRLFGMDRGLVVLPGDIWREVCLTGHWIHDALVLRWAELTQEISGAEIRTSEVLDLLLRSYVPERDVHVARQVFETLPQVECVWSGKPLSAGFDVDHILPYCLWRNNALWNLMPAAQTVNRTKSDKIPAREILIRRRGVIAGYWTELERRHPIRFGREALDLAGSGAPDHNTLFDALLEAVEVTALQRGCERWSPG